MNTIQFAMWTLTSLFAVALATSRAVATTATNAIGPSADLYIVNKNISPDGTSRSAVLAGACEDLVHLPGVPGACKKVSVKFPGPLIQGKKGDSFNLNVVNQLTDTRMLRNTSIKGSSWADGPVGVTQCPIPPDHSFRYQFKVPDQTGTFWYHSHHSTQYCDGLRGPLVVYDPKDPHKHLYDVDDESTIITLADWYHVFAPGVPKGPSPAPDSNLITGLGRMNTGPTSELAVINVKHGKRYRFRLISISCDPFYDFSIDNHTLTVIEADGENVKPLNVTSIRIFAGQRYSFVLGYTGTDNNANSAILRYSKAKHADPTAKNVVPKLPVFSESDLHPLVNVGVPGAHEPGHADILSKQGMPQDLMSAGNYIELPPNKVIELVLLGGSRTGSPHPFHLHGHNFHVIRSAGNDTYNFVDPVIRDVVSLGSLRETDRVTIRFVTDNSGPWIMHCHIDWHFEMGLAVVFAEDIKGIKKSQHPPVVDQQCKLVDTTGLPHY